MMTTYFTCQTWMALILAVLLMGMGFCLAGFIFDRPACPVVWDKPTHGDPTCGGREYQQMHNLYFDGVSMTCKMVENVPLCRNVPDGFGCVDWIHEGDTGNWDAILKNRPKTWEEAWERRTKFAEPLK